MLSFKKILMRKSAETKEVDAVKTWTVSWRSKFDKYSFSFKQEFEVFTDYDTAVEYKQALEDAFNFIRYKADNQVTLTANQ